jgi:hypothetical protein
MPHTTQRLIQRARDEYFRLKTHPIMNKVGDTLNPVNYVAKIDGYFSPLEYTEWGFNKRGFLNGTL